jgi:hypothetical protein
MKKVVTKARIPNINLQAAIFVPEKSVMYLSMNSSNASKEKYTVFDTGKLFKDEGNPVISPGGPSANAAYIKMLYKEFE